MHGDHARPEVPAVVTLHLWGVPAGPCRPRSAGWRATAARCAAPRGCASASCSAPATAAPSPSATPTRGTGACSPPGTSAAAAAAFEAGPVARRWAGIADERLRVRLRPLASRGELVGPAAVRRPGARAVRRPGRRRHPGPDRPAPAGHLLARRASGVGRPARSDGLRLAVGIGEAPVGLQGTFSLWDSRRRADRRSRYRRAPHVEAVRRTAELGWYAEELFARFAVLYVDGTLAGRSYT